MIFLSSKLQNSSNSASPKAIWPHPNPHRLGWTFVTDSSNQYARGAHFGRLSKIVLWVLAVIPAVGKIGSADLCSYRLVRENRQCRLFDEHGLNAGLSMSCWEICQGGRLMKIGVVANIGSLYADANSTARNSLNVGQQGLTITPQLGTIWNLDEELSKASKRHVNNMDNKDRQLRKWFWAVTPWLLVGEVVHEHGNVLENIGAWLEMISIH